MKFIKFTIYTTMFLLSVVFFTAHAQAATPVYYSVGQSAADLKTGTPTLTITAGAGVFSAPQTGNIGVGDRVTYNTNQVAYIAAKTHADSAHWSLITATGGLPVDISNSAVVSITREFTSLSAAVTAASNASHINNTDLIAANVVLNLPCYYDSNADTTAVTVSGYATGANNFIKIYTPNNTSTEANNSQRHQGKWDDGKYNLSWNSGYQGNGWLLVPNRNVIIDGLQIRDNQTTYGQSLVSLINGSVTNGFVKISNNIVRGNINNANVQSGISDDSNISSNIESYIYNNIVYDESGTGIYSLAWKVGGGVLGKVVIYNNTVYSSHPSGFTGIRVQNFASGRYAVVKNNLVHSNSNSDFAATVPDVHLNNISKDNTSYDAGYRSKTVSFVDVVGRNFHLSASDTAAKKAGVNLQNDPYLHFSNDIDGQERAGSWDIGADEMIETQMQTQQSSPGLDVGLVGHWTFDGKDINGSIANDTSGNNNNGTISGATPTVGKFGQGFNFNGTSDYVDFGTGATLNFPVNGEFALSGWVKTKENAGAIVSFRNSTDSVGWGSIVDIMLGYDGVVTSNGKIMSLVRQSGTSSGHARVTGGTINDGGWHQFVLTRDTAGKIELFLDTISQGSNTGAQSAGAITTNLRAVGAERRWIQDSGMTADQRFLNGSVDDVRMYDRKLSNNEIVQLYNKGIDRLSAPAASSGNTNGLVGYWSFDGKTINGTTVNDLSGLGNNGIISGQAKPALGKIGQAMIFDGVNEADPNADYVNIGSPAALDNIENSGGGGMSVNTWIYPRSAGVGSNGTIVGKNFNAGNWRLNFGGSGRIQFKKNYDISDLTVVSGDNFCLNNQWCHLVVTWDGSSNGNNTHLYNNGVEEDVYIARNSGTGNKLSDESESLYIGGNPQHYIFDGKIDEVRIYNRVLSFQEIRELYGLGQVRLRK